MIHCSIIVSLQLLLQRACGKAPISIGSKELNEMIQGRQGTLEMNHFGNKNYNFTVEDLKLVIIRVQAINSRKEKCIWFYQGARNVESYRRRKRQTGEEIPALP